MEWIGFLEEAILEGGTGGTPVKSPGGKTSGDCPEYSGWNVRESMALGIIP